MQCTGAAKPGVFKWTITRRGPVIAGVSTHENCRRGCSDVLVDIFGERGVHARSVLGASSLRGGLPVILRGVGVTWGLTER